MAIETIKPGPFRHYIGGRAVYASRRLTQVELDAFTDAMAQLGQALDTVRSFVVDTDTGAVVELEVVGHNRSGRTRRLAVTSSTEVRDG